MSRKKFEKCEIVFSDNKTLTEKILLMFSTENLLNCYNAKNAHEYRKVIETPLVQMVLKDKEAVDTIVGLCEGNLNICDMSKVMVVHRNTILYRIHKIHKILGLDIRVFNHAMALKNLLTINDMINSK